jgi:phage terminase large subunit
MRTSGDIWLDFNPSHRFWVHDELPPTNDTEWLTLTYLDNEACPEGARQELELYKQKSNTSKYWQNKWNVYGLGQLGSLDGVVFEEFIEWEECETLPKDFEWQSYGLDFGYTNDVSAIVEVILQRGELWLHEHLYKTGMTNKMISDDMQLKDIRMRSEIFADSSEPKSIDELYGWGWHVKGATKGRDSIRQGIDVMKRYKINITKSSVNLLREFRKYAWDKDKEGRTLMTPLDKDNHAIDAARYAITMKLGMKQLQTYA